MGATLARRSGQGKLGDGTGKIENRLAGQDSGERASAMTGPSPDVPVSEPRVLVAPNPGPLTGTGTNTYLVGTGDVVLIDPGPAIPSHLASILAALAPGERIAAILVTHSHLDHTALVPELAAATGAPVLGAGPTGSGRSPLMARLAAAGMPTGGEGFDTTYRPDRVLLPGEVLQVGDVRIDVLPTPGHTGCHLGFACADRLFSGDTVMGWSTSLVSPPDGDMGAYLSTLSALSLRHWHSIHPGHGPRIADPALRLADLMAHRRGREASVLAALAGGAATPAELARRIYATTPPALLPAAARNVLAHLIDLTDRGLVSTGVLPATTATYHLT